MAAPAVTLVEAAAGVSFCSKASAAQVGIASQWPVLLLHCSVGLQPVVRQLGAQALAMQIVAGGAQAASVLQGGGGTMSQRPVVLLQTLEPEHWIPPAWLQPGTHWPVSQTWAGAPQAASFEQGPASGWQRPVLELHTSPAPQLRPPGRPQPGVQRPASQMLEGAPQVVSLAQGGGGSQRPAAPQMFPPEQAVPPGSAQPATHWPFSQIAVGERHSGSELQRFIGASQRPLVALQLSPPEHWMTEPMLAQPGTQALFSHTWPPPPQSGSALQPLGVGEGLMVGVGVGVGVGTGSLSLHTPKSQYWFDPHSSSAAQLIFRLALSAWH